MLPMHRVRLRSSLPGGLTVWSDGPRHFAHWKPWPMIFNDLVIYIYIHIPIKNDKKNVIFHSYSRLPEGTLIKMSSVSLWVSHSIKYSYHLSLILSGWHHLFLNIWCSLSQKRKPDWQWQQVWWCYLPSFWVSWGSTWLTFPCRTWASHDSRADAADADKTNEPAPGLRIWAHCVMRKRMEPVDIANWKDPPFLNVFHR